LTFNDIEGEHYGACPLGHDKLDTTARYARVATNTIREVMSPLDRLTPLTAKNDKSRGEPPA
jgi:integrase/recombinase XerD